MGCGWDLVLISWVCFEVFICVWWCDIVAVFVGCVGFVDSVRVFFVLCMSWVMVFLS
jgi:hypothetical protein